MKKLKLIASNFALSILLLGALVALPACHNVAPGGAYAGDKFLYEADNTITTSHAVLQDFVTWEANYRATLAQWPQIKQFADTVMKDGPGWFMSAIAVRDAYKANPTSQAKTALQAALDVIHTAIAQAQQNMATAKIPAGTLPTKPTALILHLDSATDLAFAR